MSKQKHPIAVLISGNGSNLQAIINACNAGECPADIKIVISNNPNAYGLTRAKNAGIPTQVLKNDEDIQNALDNYNVELVVLAGFMKILGPTIVKHFKHRMLNIHPSLLPKYPGLNTHRRALEAGENEHGVTIHLVTDELDSGPILAQESIPVNKDDTPESLEQKIHALEHKLYPKAIKTFLTGDVPKKSIY